MRICLVSSEHGSYGGLGTSVARLARLLAREHEVTAIHTYEDAPARSRDDDPPTLRHIVVAPSSLPPMAFSCDDHARSAATMAAIEAAYGDTPPHYLEVPDYRGHGLVPLQAREAGHRSLRGTAIAVRLRSLAELICIRDGTWARPEHRMVFDIEHEALRLADFVVVPDDSVLDLYRGVLEQSSLERVVRARLPFDPGVRPGALPPEGPLRLLYAGRLQRAKGALDLVEACLGADQGGWRLTMIGEDTATAPLGQSVRATIETMCDGDERVELLDPLPHEELQGRYREHHLLVAPSLVEVWSNSALEGMRAGLPVLATPVGGLRGIVEDGDSGWLAGGSGPRPLRRSLERLLAEPGEVERVRLSGAPYERFRRLTDPQAVLEEYRQLLAAARPRRAPARTFPAGSEGAAARPTVSGIVTYFGEHRYVADAVDSLLSQTHPVMEVLIVDDGSFEAADGILARLGERDRVRVLYKPNGGEAGSRNLGALLADGEYVVFLDADNTLEPHLVERAVAMLVADPALAYVTPWLRFVAEEEGVAEGLGGGYAPLGNGVRSDDAVNSDGDAIAVMRRSLFARDGYRFDPMAPLLSDWELYRQLREHGRFGAIVPEALANYRVRRGSISRVLPSDAHALAWEEALSRRRARAIEGAPTG